MHTCDLTRWDVVEGPISPVQPSPTLAQFWRAADKLAVGLGYTDRHDLLRQIGYAEMYRQVQDQEGYKALV